MAAKWGYKERKQEQREKGVPVESRKSELHLQDDGTAEENRENL